MCREFRCISPHLITRKNPSLFWLYVGQSAKLCDRIKSHNNLHHRQQNPSLHCYVWQATLDMESTFVTLALHEPPTCQTEQFLLNLQEMWMACISRL